MALALAYFPDPQLRGTPLDTFRWVAFDTRGGTSAEMEVTINVKCAPGFIVEVVPICQGAG
eukprot:2119308-Pyramimonas_sp.AAC.2